MTKGENSLSPKSKAVSFLVRNQNTYEKLKTKSDNSLTEKTGEKERVLSHASPKNLGYAPSDHSPNPGITSSKPIRPPP